MTPALLRAEGLTAGYGKLPILHGVTLEVRVARGNRDAATIVAGWREAMKGVTP